MPLMGRHVIAEFYRLFRQNLHFRQMLLNTMGILLLGVVAPFYLGLGFLDILILMVYACLSWVFVTPLVADSTAGIAFQPELPAAPAGRILTARLLAATLYATLYGLVILTLALSVVNIYNRTGHILLPKTIVLFWVSLVALSGAFCFAALTVRIAVRAKNVEEAKRNSRRIALLFVVLALAPSKIVPRRVDRVLSYFNSRELHYVAIPLILFLLTIGGLALWWSLRALRPEEPIRFQL